jgi:S1-C subfamily serine protease
LQDRIEEARQREEELKRQLAEASAGQAQLVRTELATTRERLAALESEQGAGERIIREYGPGVCLIQGAYAFYDASSRPLRYKLGEDGQPLRLAEGGYALDVAGAGPVHIVEYLGTGFLVDLRGLVLTNRHVAEPWWNDTTARAVMDARFKPRYTLFRAFFPHEPLPFELDVYRLSERVDLALVRLNLRGRPVPVIPLDRSGKGAVAGQPAVVVGYPAGLQAILAKADSRTVNEILASHGPNFERVTEALARKGLIRPSTTQGHIGDVTQTSIVFDAQTTHGGSGAPVFNKYREAVAVEYSGLEKFPGSSFGVPVAYVLELIRLTGTDRPRAPHP